MSVPPDRSDPPVPAAIGRRAIKWDAVAAIIASLVGLLALVVAAYTAYIQRYTARIQLEQVRAQVWPRVVMGRSDVDGQYELTALNQGVGPAIVESVQVLVAGRPVPDWDALAARLGFTPRFPWVSSTLNRMVLTPGEHLSWIRFKDAADVDAFTVDWTRFNIEARVCYSSTLGESWLVVFRPGAIAIPRAVPDCPELPASAQFSD